MDTIDSEHPWLIPLPDKANIHGTNAETTTERQHAALKKAFIFVEYLQWSYKNI